MIVTIIGMFLMTFLPVNGSYAVNVLPSILLTSLGMGAVFMPLTLVATTGLKNEDQGLASGLFNTSQQIGGALGIAALSTIATSHTTDALGTGSALPVALVDGFHAAFLVGAIAAALGIIASLTLIRRDELEVEVVALPEQVEPALDAA